MHEIAFKPMNRIRIIPSKFKIKLVWPSFTYPLLILLLYIFLSIDVSFIFFDALKKAHQPTWPMALFQPLLFTLLVSPSTRLAGLYILFTALVMFNLYVIGSVNLQADQVNGIQDIIKLNRIKHLLSANILMLISLVCVGIQLKSFTSHR